MTWNFLKHVGWSESLLFEDHEQQKIESGAQDMQGVYSDPVEENKICSFPKSLFVGT